MTTPSKPIGSKDNPPLNPGAGLVLQAQKMEMVGRMTSSVIHDLNNFLTVIQLNAALLEEVAEDPEERNRMISEIQRACGTAADLTRNMLSFARQKNSKNEALELRKLLTEAVGFLQCLVSHKAEISMDFPETEIWVMGDRSALLQAFMNLAINALDADSKRGLQWRLRADDQEVEASITDFGSGIPEEDLPHIFEPFFTTKPEGKGTGLGLAIVRQVIEAHGGRIAVESVWGQGTTFRIVLPRLSEVASVAESVVTPPSPPQAVAGNILVVEDDARIREVTGQILTRAGYQVWLAANAEEGRQIWADHASEIGLLITDIVLPGTVSGEDLAAELRKLSPTLPLLFMSGNQTTRHFPDAPFIAKPFAPPALIQTIRELI